MKAKDKAKELVDKMNMKQKPSLNPSTNSFNINDTIYNAKQCALIAVDEIIEVLDLDLGLNDEGKQFWQDVKKEIEKL